MADNFLSPEEVDALLEGVDETKAPGAPQGEVRDYNLATQERIVRGKMPSMDIINDRFARQLRIELYNLLSASIEVSMTPLITVKYSTFAEQVLPGSSINLISTDSLRGIGLLVFDPALVILSVDSLFGGDGRVDNIASERDFTATEQRIIHRIVDVLLATYNKSWSSIHSTDFKRTRTEKDIGTARIALSSEVVVAVSFEITIGESSGKFHFCFPYSMLEPILEVLTSPPLGAVALGDKRWLKMMKQQVQGAKLDIVADLATADMKLKDVLNMKVGDVIPLAIEDLIEGKIDGIPVMQCKYGLFNGQYALKVEKLLRSNAMEYVKGESNGD
jgi:flagellar motor switch protein FliM